MNMNNTTTTSCSACGIDTDNTAMLCDRCHEAADEDWLINEVVEGLEGPKAKPTLTLKPKQHAHRHCVHWFLSKGWAIHMEDLDNGGMVRLTDYHRIIGDIECVDGGLDFYVEDPANGRRYWIGMAMGYGNQPDESVHDYSVCTATDEWFKEFGIYYEQESVDFSNHGVEEVTS